jgi:hypothetical protein
MSWRQSGSQGGQQSNRTPSGNNTPRGGRTNTPVRGGASNAVQEGAGQGRGQGQGNQRGGRRDNHSGASNAGANNTRAQQPQAQQQAAPETHVPVNGYNAKDVQGEMTKCKLTVRFIISSWANWEVKHITKHWQLVVEVCRLLKMKMLSLT